MGKIVSVINLKGGVGKTTTVVTLAEFLVSEYYKKVLVIDLDAQTNATVMLIDQNKWKIANDDVCQEGCRMKFYVRYLDIFQNFQLIFNVYIS